MKKKAGGLSKAKRVRSVARERVGIPKPSRPLSEKRERDKPKYKKPLIEAEA
jgi:hypothetical protein